MDRKYQVFLSSTYKDLKNERKSAIHEILKANCIPVGMELFPASNRDPLTYIKKVIDESDFYILIAGTRYGTVLDGKSFTERELDYALEKKKKIIALVYQGPKEKQRSDESDYNQSKLREFKEYLCKNFTVKFWCKSHELENFIFHSLTSFMEESQQEGWIKFSTVKSQLQKLNRRIKKLESKKLEKNTKIDINPIISGEIFTEQKKLSQLVKTKLEEINVRAGIIIGREIKSSSTGKNIVFDAHKISNSLSVIGIPLHVCCEAIEKTVDELEVTRRKKQIIETSDIRAAVSEALYRMDSEYGNSKEIQLWADNYVRRYGKPDKAINIIEETSTGQIIHPLKYKLAKEIVLPLVLKRIYGEGFEEKRQAISSDEVNIFAKEVVKTVKSLNTYELKLTTLASLMTEISSSQPHPWFIFCGGERKNVEYNLDRSKHHALKLIEMMKTRDINSGFHSLTECIHHSSSGILAMYGVNPGIGYLTPLNVLAKHIKNAHESAHQPLIEDVTSALNRYQHSEIAIDEFSNQLDLLLKVLKSFKEVNGVAWNQVAASAKIALKISDAFEFLSSNYLRKSHR